MYKYFSLSEIKILLTIIICTTPINKNTYLPTWEYSILCNFFLDRKAIKSSGKIEKSFRQRDSL